MCLLGKTWTESGDSRWQNCTKATASKEMAELRRYRGYKTHCSRWPWRRSVNSSELCFSEVWHFLSIIIQALDRVMLHMKLAHQGASSGHRKHRNPINNICISLPLKAGGSSLAAYQRPKKQKQKKNKQKCSRERILWRYEAKEAGFYLKNLIWKCFRSLILCDVTRKRTRVMFLGWRWRCQPLGL